MPVQPPLWADSYAPGVPLHLDYGDTTVLDLWESTARRHPGRPALDFLGRVSSYAEVDDEVRSTGVVAPIGPDFGALM